jgi:hypothetical protein
MEVFNLQISGTLKKTERIALRLSLQLHYQMMQFLLQEININVKVLTKLLSESTFIHGMSL